MKLKILILDDNVREFYENHGHFHEGDSGLDLFMPSHMMLNGSENSFLTGLGIACESDTSFYIYPRSSISKTPLRLCNSVGVIDKGYRGEIMACFDNLSEDEYYYRKGDRLLQICAPNLEPIEFEIVEELSETTRGTGGIGSTGR